MPNRGRVRRAEKPGPPDGRSVGDCAENFARPEPTLTNFSRASESRLALCVLMALALAVLCWAGAPPHPGRLDELGCHNDRTAGDYHCHRGSLAGRHFASKRQVLAALGFNPDKYVSPTRIKRDHAQRRKFEVMTGYPHGRSGYVVDHIVPLPCGGADSPPTCSGKPSPTPKSKTNGNAKAVGRTEPLAARG